MKTKEENNLSIIIDKLEEEIETEANKISDIIDKLTDITFKKNFKLEERLFLESQKISKLKNFLIKIFTFGCYDKNKILENKLKQNKLELDTAIIDEKKFQEEYDDAKLSRQKLIYKFKKIVKTKNAGQEFSVSKSLINKVNDTNTNGQFKNNLNS